MSNQGTNTSTLYAVTDSTQGGKLSFVIAQVVQRRNPSREAAGKLVNVA